MPFGTVPVWDGGRVLIPAGATPVSPMPFGTVPVWDLGSMSRVRGGLNRVSNAFRHGPGLGQILDFLNREAFRKLSPMPFGTVPVWDSEVRESVPLVFANVSNAFRHGPGLGQYS